MAEVYTDSIRAKANGETQDVPIRDTTKAPAIIPTVTGTAEVTITDASDESKLQNLTMHGNTNQVQTTGAQLFDASKLPSKTQGGATVTNNGDGSFTVSGSGSMTEGLSQVYDYSHEESIKLLQAGKLIRVNQTSQIVPTVVMQLRFGNGNQLTINTSGTMIKQEYIENPDFYIRLLMFAGSGSQIVTGTYKPMVYQDGDGTWEPFSGGVPSPSPDWKQDIQNSGKEVNGQYEVGVKITGTNLFDISQVEDTWNGSFGIINNGNSLTVTSASNDSTINTNKTLKQLCPMLKVGKKYVINAECDELSKRVYLTEEKKVWMFNEPIEMTEEYSNSTVRFYAKGKTSSTDTISNIVVNEGETALPYEPYQTPQSITLHSPRPLTKWDRLVKKDGVWNWEFNSNTEVFDGSEDEAITVYNPSLENVYTFVITAIKKSKKLGTENLFCNKFKIKASSWGINEPYLMSGHDGHGYIYFNVKKTDISSHSVEGIKTWLQSNPITVLYQTATPEYIPLSEEEQSAMDALVMYAPTSIVSADTGDLSVELEVSYIADTTTYLTANFVPKSDYDTLEARVAALETTTVNNVTEQ